MRIISVDISNILSIEKVYVEFSENGLMLVDGWNYDVGRANGAGKTAIFNAISFALFDKLPRKVTATEILRRGSKSGYVRVVLEVAGTQYTVERYRPKGVLFFEGSNKLAITQDGFVKIIGLTYDQFMISMYAAQGAAKRFLSVNDGDKKQFLLQLLNLEEFSSCRTIADGKIKSLETQLTSNQSKIDSMASKVDAYTESLVDENVVQSSIAACNRSIATLTDLLIQAQKVSRPDLSKYLKLEEDVATKKVEFAALRARREMLHDSYRKLAAKNAYITAPVDRCRSCGTWLDVTAAKVAHEKELAERSSEMAEIKRGIDDCDSSLAREAGVLEISKKVKDRKSEESAEYEAARSQVGDLQAKIALQQQELKNLNVKLQNNSDLLSKIKELQAESAKLSTLRANILRDIELYNTVSAMYSPTGAQAYILDSVIDSFNERVGEYVNLVWSNMTYELKSYKENVSGDVTAKFSELLLMDGKETSIGSLSGGEFRALSLCVDFALIEVMERQFGISLSPIILDEPFDGLDGAGREFIIELLEKFSEDRQVVVIDHASEVKSMFSKVLTVEKRNGITTVT